MVMVGRWAAMHGCYDYCARRQVTAL